MKFSLRKPKKEKEVAPRLLEAIKAEYEGLKANLADSDYQIYIHTESKKQLHYRMLELNQEGAKRQQLDKEAQDAALKAGESDVQP